MLRNILVLLLLSMGLPCFAQVDPIYVNGVIVRANMPDFDQTRYIRGTKRRASSNTMQLKIPVYGDAGQRLIFDIDARVSARGDYKLNHQCIIFFPQPGGIVLPSEGQFGNCTIENVNPSDRFKFNLKMRARCNSLVLDQDAVDLSTRLSAAQVEQIDREANALIDRGAIYEFWPMIYNTRRTASLLIDKELSTGGGCDELVIDIEGDDTYITDIDLDVFIGEAF